MLKPWVVLFILPFEGYTPQVFLCQAEDGDHADEQCLDAYPEADIVWAEQGTDPQQAMLNYWQC